MSGHCSIPEYRLSTCEWFEMDRGDISEDQIEFVLGSPGQIKSVRAGRIVCQFPVHPTDGAKACILRVVVDTDRVLPVVVTAYRTSKVAKYWSSDT